MTDAPEQPELTPEDEADILAWIEQEQQAAMGGTPEPPAPPVEDVAEGSAPEAEDVPEGAAPSVEDVAEGMAPGTEDVPEGVVPPVEDIPATTLPDDVTPEDQRILDKFLAENPDMAGEGADYTAQGEGVNPFSDDPQPGIPLGPGDTSDAEALGDAVEQLERDVADVTETARVLLEAELLREVPEEGPTWFKASANWTTAAGDASYVAAYEVLTGDPIAAPADVTLATTTTTVYLPRHGTGQDPNVRQNAFILAFKDLAGKWVAVDSKLDGTILKSAEMWAGAVADIATQRPGWQICDGTNSTPDLRGRFVMGVDPADGAGDDSEADIGDTGGTRTHTHPTHADHPYALQYIGLGGDIADSGGLGWGFVLLTHDAHNTVDHRPRFYVLAYIMRVS